MTRPAWNGSRGVEALFYCIRATTTVTYTYGTKLQTEQDRGDGVTALRILDKIYMALGVTAHEINGKSQGFAVCEARQIPALAMHEAGMSWVEVGNALGGRDKCNVRKIANTAKRRCRGTTAMAYIDARMPVSERAFVKALSKPSNEHTHRIIDDMRRGMSAYQTLEFWPYQCGIDLATVEAVRRSVA